MTEDQFKTELTSLYDQYETVVTKVAGGRDEWVTLQYDKAFEMMSGSWNPAMAEDFVANLEAGLENHSDGLSIS